MYRTPPAFGVAFARLTTNGMLWMPPVANAVSNVSTVAVLMFTPCTAAFSKASGLVGSNKF
jgi:hypothetical protein